MGKALALVTLAVLASAPGWTAPTITVSFPAWTKTVTAADLVTPSTAGSNVTSSYDNTNGTINVANTNGKSLWRISIARTAVPAPGDGLIFEFARSGDGTGTGSVKPTPYATGVFVPITTTVQEVITGKEDRAGITFTIRISNILLTLPIGTHSTSITLTIT